MNTPYCRSESKHTQEFNATIYKRMLVTVGILDHVNYTDKVTGDVSFATSATAGKSVSRILMKIRMHAQTNIVERGPSATAASMKCLKFQT